MEHAVGWQQFMANTLMHVQLLYEMHISSANGYILNLPRPKYKLGQQNYANLFCYTEIHKLKGYAFIYAILLYLHLHYFVALNVVQGKHRLHILHALKSEVLMGSCSYIYRCMIKGSGKPTSLRCIVAYRNVL